MAVLSARYSHKIYLDSAPTVIPSARSSLVLWRSIYIYIPSLCVARCYSIVRITCSSKMNGLYWLLAIVIKCGGHPLAFNLRCRIFNKKLTSCIYIIIIPSIHFVSHKSLLSCSCLVECYPVRLEDVLDLVCAIRPEWDVEPVGLFSLHVYINFVANFSLRVSSVGVAFSFILTYASNSLGRALASFGVNPVAECTRFLL